AARSPSVSSNAPSALEFKEQVTDAVADWVAAGFAAGPFPPSARPVSAFFNGWPADRPRSPDPAWIPPAILAWIDYPAVDPLLGDKILSQISQVDGGI
ncbi:MAG: hypothetical protein ACK559_31010, partial [bacterium]